ncbi:MAG: (2Fe-2S)-binding protein [Kiloniellaceae bacterium]
MVVLDSGRFQRLGEEDRPAIGFSIDGRAALAREGDTLLVALLVNAPAVRESEFGDGSRAGFCLMGACQDCWVWTESGERLRACTTMIADGIRILTKEPQSTWPVLA